MTEKVHVQAKFDAGTRFSIESGSGHSVTLDGEHQAGYSPMELVLASLAGCSGISVISIVLKKQQVVKNYEVRVEGIRAETYPLVFTDIRVEHILTGHNIRPEAVERAIELAEMRYCPVSVMPGKVTNLTHTYQIIEAE